MIAVLSLWSHVVMQVKGQWSDTTTEYGYDFWWAPPWPVQTVSDPAHAHQCRLQAGIHPTCEVRGQYDAGISQGTM